MVRVGPDGVGYRQSEEWSSTSRLGVTQQGFPWGRLFAQDAESLTPAEQAREARDPDRRPEPLQGSRVPVRGARDERPRPPGDAPLRPDRRRGRRRAGHRRERDHAAADRRDREGGVLRGGDRARAASGERARPVRRAAAALEPRPGQRSRRAPEGSCARRRRRSRSLDRRRSRSSSSSSWPPARSVSPSCSRTCGRPSNSVAERPRSTRRASRSSRDAGSRCGDPRARRALPGSRLSRRLPSSARQVRADDPPARHPVAAPPRRVDPRHHARPHPPVLAAGESAVPAGALPPRRRGTRRRVGRVAARRSPRPSSSDGVRRSARSSSSEARSRRSSSTRSGVAETSAEVNKALMFLLSFVVVLYLTVSGVRRLADVDFVARCLVAGRRRRGVLRDHRGAHGLQRLQPSRGRAAVPPRARRTSADTSASGRPGCGCSGRRSIRSR